MLALIQEANSKVSEFRWEDWAILKVVLMLVGVIAGCTFAEICKKLRPLLVIVWVCAYTYIILKTFVLPKK